ncbi:MAG: hypothetical protein ACOXZO_03670 [Bacteroidales bacterium]|nr:hypothetical protein [Bacteroidales bacterium]
MTRSLWGTGYHVLCILGYTYYSSGPGKDSPSILIIETECGSKIRTESCIPIITGSLRQ